jgi:hypothetical protein
LTAQSVERSPHQQESTCRHFPVKPESTDFVANHRQHRHHHHQNPTRSTRNGVLLENTRNDLIKIKTKRLKIVSSFRQSNLTGLESSSACPATHDAIRRSVANRPSNKTCFVPLFLFAQTEKRLFDKATQLNVSHRMSLCADITLQTERLLYQMICDPIHPQVAT